MAAQISRDILNKETNARFWAQTGYKPGKQLDPNNPLDKAKMPVWMDIFRKVNAEANAGSLITTYDRPEVAQPLADAAVASTIAAVHVDAGAKAPDPGTAQQHTSAALTAQQVATQKLKEAAGNQPPTVSPKLVDDAAREAAKTPPPPNAPAIDQIAHAQMQNGKNGQSGQNEKMLRPEDDPWDSRYVPKSEREKPPTPSKSPREQPPARPSRPSREQPPAAILYKETNTRFWNRTHYKPNQKLDMTIPEDRKMAKIWLEILHEVEREAKEGTLTFTSPELAPTPDGPRPPPPRPTPPPMPQQPMPQQPMPQQPMPQQPMPQQPMPSPGMQPPFPGMQQPWPPPGMQRPMPPPWMQQPMPRPGMQRPMPPPGMQRPMPPGMQPPPGMQRPMQPMQPMQPGMQRPGAPTEGAPPISSPTEGVSKSTEGTPVTPETAPPEGMSTMTKIGLGLGGLGVLAAIVYAATRKPSGASSRPRAPAAARVPFGRATPAIASSSALPSSRGGGY